MGLLLAQVPANSPFFFNNIFTAIPANAKTNNKMGTK
jgi:hypothetical protein